MVGSAQTIVEHIGTIARQSSITIAIGFHHLRVDNCAILCSHGWYCTECKSTIGVLDKFVTYQCTTPVGLVAIACTHIDIFLMDICTRTERAPAPDIAIFSVRGSLSCIEGTGIEYTLMTIGRPFGTIVEAALQFLVGRSNHVLHLTAPTCTEALAINQELKKYQRLADAFTPLAKGMNSEYANQNAYDAISIHGGSGFIMEYKSQRLYRDARIFSIYEGTTQLQVVAAIRYITNGTMLNNIKDMLAALPADANAALKTRVEKLIPIYEEALANVKALENQDAQDFLARRLYDMTAELVMSLLIIRDAAKAPELFAKSAQVYVRMTEEDVYGKSAYIKAFQVEDLENFKATQEEEA